MFYGDEKSYFSNLMVFEKTAFYSFIFRKEYEEIPTFFKKFRSDLTVATDNYALDKFSTVLHELKSIFFEDVFQATNSFLEEASDLICLLENPSKDDLKKIESFFLDEERLKEFISSNFSKKFEPFYQENERLIGYLEVIEKAIESGYNDDGILTFYTQASDKIHDFILSVEKKGMEIIESINFSFEDESIKIDKVGWKPSVSHLKKFPHMLFLGFDMNFLKYLSAWRDYKIENRDVGYFYV
jgi:hypothetical protein